jgi:hypothetical protein
MKLSLYEDKTKNALKEAFKKELAHDDKFLKTFEKEHFDNHEPTTEQLKTMMAEQPLNALYYLFYTHEYKNYLFIDCVFDAVFKIDNHLDLWVNQIYKDILDIGAKTGSDVSKIQNDLEDMKSDLVPSVQKILDCISGPKNRNVNNEGDMIV